MLFGGGIIMGGGIGGGGIGGGIGGGGMKIAFAWLAIGALAKALFCIYSFEK